MLYKDVANRANCFLRSNKPAKSTPELDETALSVSAVLAHGVPQRMVREVAPLWIDLQRFLNVAHTQKSQIGRMAAKKGHIVERIISVAGRVALEEINEGRTRAELHAKVIDGEYRKLNDDDLAAIAEVLKGNTTLTWLNLNTNQIGDAGASAIAEALKVNKTLQTLSLDFNHIGDAGASAIAEALKVNKTLQELHLEHNQIGDAGASAIAEAMKVNKTFQILNLHVNHIGDAGASAIAEALKVNNTLRSLRLRMNPFTDTGMIAMAEALVGNTNLEKLDIFNGTRGITNKSVPALKEMLQNSHIKDMGILAGTLISEEAQDELKDLLYAPVGSRTFQSRAVSEKKKKKYSSFIARHPLDDGISHHVAIKIKNALSSSDGEVYVDGGRYQHLDISQLLNEMDQSQTVVLLLLNIDTLKMPVCLIELNHAIVNEIPIQIEIGEENEISMEETIQLVDHLETEMKEAGMELMKWCGVDIVEVGKNMRKMMMDAARNNTIKRINTNKDQETPGTIQ